MTAETVGALIVKVGVEPAIIAALLFLIFKLITDFQKTVSDLSGAISDLTDVVERLGEYVRGRRDA